MNNGFQSAKAAGNIERAVRKTSADLITFRPNHDLFLKLCRNFLIKAGEFCTPCNTLIGTLAYRIAEQNKIDLIMSGSSNKWSPAVHGMSIARYANRPYFENVLMGCMDLSEYCGFLPKEKTFYIPGRLTGGPKQIAVFDYLAINKDEVEKTLQKELEWEPPSDEVEHGDCLLNQIKDYIVCNKWGFSEITGAYSAMIRNRQISREEALVKAEHEEVRTQPPQLDFFLKSIGMTRHEFDRAITEHHFTDIPNEESRLYRLTKAVYKSMRSLVPI